MAPRALLASAVILSAWACGALGQPPSSPAGLPCVQKLLPCQPYLHAAARPPPACCGPLDDMVRNDAPCLCAVFNNDQLLKAFNVTRDEALRLPEACGSSADLSLCNSNGKSPGTSPSVPSTASPPPPPPPSSKGSASVVLDKGLLGMATVVASWTSAAVLLF